MLISHWQSLFSNGLWTGLRALDLAAQRINEHFSDTLEWVNFSELMNRTLRGDTEL